MKLQKKVRQELEAIIGAIEIGNSYLLSSQVAGIAHHAANPNGASYTIRNTRCLDTIAGNPPEHINIFTAHVGSKACYIDNGLRRLKRLLENCD